MNKCRTRSKVAAKKRSNRKQSVTLHRIATLKPGVRKRILSASSLADQPEDTKRKKNKDKVQPKSVNCSEIYFPPIPVRLRLSLFFFFLISSSLFIRAKSTRKKALRNKTDVTVNIVA